MCPECGALGSAPDALQETPQQAPTVDESHNTAAYVANEMPTKDAEPRKPATADLAAIPGYEVLGVLGRGGMGIVYKARHKKLKRLAALKMILAGAHAGPGDLERFRLESEAIARVQHPNIVQIHEVGDFDGKPYFALEYVDGGSLREKLAGRPCRRARQPSSPQPSRGRSRRRTGMASFTAT